MSEERCDPQYLEIIRYKNCPIIRLQVKEVLDAMGPEQARKMLSIPNLQVGGSGWGRRGNLQVDGGGIVHPMGC